MFLQCAEAHVWWQCRWRGACVAAMPLAQRGDDAIGAT
jgi:hypothetical protein